MKIVAAVLVACLLAAGAAALATGGDAPSKPTRSSSPLVSIGQPITPYRAGKPRNGWMEMRARNPGGGPAFGVLYFTHRRRHVRERCNEPGPEDRVRDYPIGAGGSCEGRETGLPREPLSVGVSSGSNMPMLIRGTASQNVDRIVVSGPGGTYDVPLSRHRAFLILYSPKARGRATLTAHLRGGATRFYVEDIPMSLIPPGSVKAKDPAGVGTWSLNAQETVAGPRTGQTCGQFQLEGRRTGAVGAPLCGDLRANPLFADATQFGPAGKRDIFGRGPRTPKRLVVWGAVAPAVRKVAVVGPTGRRELRLSRVGRAFISVYPEGTPPAAITVEATYGDGKVVRYRAPRRLFVATLEHRASRVR